MEDRERRKASPVVWGVGCGSIGERFDESLVVLRIFRTLHWSQDIPLTDPWLDLGGIEQRERLPLTFIHSLKLPQSH